MKTETLFPIYSAVNEPQLMQFDYDQRVRRTNEIREARSARLISLLCGMSIGIGLGVAVGRNSSEINQLKSDNQRLSEQLSGAQNERDAWIQYVSTEIAVEQDRAKVEQVINRDLGIYSVAHIESRAGFQMVVYGNGNTYDVNPEVFEQFLLVRSNMLKEASDGKTAETKALERFWTAYTGGELRNATLHIVLGNGSFTCDIASGTLQSITPDVENFDSNQCGSGEVAAYRTAATQGVQSPPQMIINATGENSDEINKRLGEAFDQLMLGYGGYIENDSFKLSPAAVALSNGVSEAYSRHFDPNASLPIKRH
jgi:hypothetical protein